MKRLIPAFGIVFFATACSTSTEDQAGNTEITRWPDNKRAAISLTYDDGTINQMTVARPIMNRLGFPATFFILTGKIDGSAKGKFIGRDPDEIINETATVMTNEDNFFERASLVAYTGIEGAVGFHTRAGSLYESGRVEQAYAVIDDAYKRIREGGPGIPVENYENYPEDTTTWEDLKTYAAEGHEIASHTITHPRLSVLDEANLLYELEQSKADIIKYLGDRYTFSAECPFGTEDERVMEYAHKVYPALRNRMPEPYLEELDRGSRGIPGASDKEYVQWQRGPLTNTGMDLMESWVDTCMAHDNIWLVLVFHGVEGIGWEPRTGEELETYFTYIQDRQEALWVATFGDVTKYMRERQNSTVTNTYRRGRIEIAISSTLDPEVYDVPVTLKTYVPGTWDRAMLEPQDGESTGGALTVQEDEKGSFVLFQVNAGVEKVVVSGDKGA